MTIEQGQPQDQLEPALTSSPAEAPRRPVLLTSFIKTAIAAEEQKITPVGAILYREGKQLMLIGEDEEGRLRSHDTETPEGFKKEIVLESGRVHDFSYFEQIDVAQVDLNPISINTFRSIRTKPSVTVRMPYTNPADGSEGLFVTDEDQLLRVFTGEEGGIAVFDGADLPESNALVLEKKAADKRYGLVFFFHPEESNIGIDSVEGIYQFLTNLNEEFSNKAAIPVQEQALTALDRLINLGFIQMDSEVRLELLRTQIIAHARRSRENGPEHLDFLRKTLPNFQPGLVGALNNWLGFDMTGKKYTDELNTSVDKLIMADKNPGREPASNPVEVAIQLGEQSILGKLQTQKAITLRRTIGDYYAKQSPPMTQFMKSLAEMVAEAKSEAEFYDAELLLKELRKQGDYVYEYYNWSFSADRLKGKRLNTHSECVDRVSFIIEEMTASLIKRKMDTFVPK